MKRKIKPNKIKSPRLFIFGIISVLLIVCALQVHKRMESTNAIVATITPIPEMRRIYFSKTMHISFDVSSTYVIEDKGSFISLKKDGGEILISSIGTNGDSLRGYLLDIANYNHLILTNEEDLSVNNYETIKVDINNKRNYLFYKDHDVISIETESPDLYPDMDNIAHSLHYTK